MISRSMTHREVFGDLSEEQKEYLDLLEDLYGFCKTDEQRNAVRLLEEMVINEWPR